MRHPTDIQKLEAFMAALGRHVSGAGRVYLTGGSCALLYAWRATTLDIDLKAAPEPDGFFEAIAALKEQLNVNVELAAPDQFIPAVPGWEDRSIFIARHGRVDFYHYDFYSQALAKLERGHERDGKDVAGMLVAGLITTRRLMEFYEAIEPKLLRYPAIKPREFRRKVTEFCTPPTP
jgi:hypothetical protein